MPPGSVVPGGWVAGRGPGHDPAMKPPPPATDGNGYQPHIDGIRAIAVSAVFFHHLFPRFCVGGFTGVDVFLVISGFLISRGIFADQDAGTFTLSSFYHRRAKRIVPAFTLVLVSVLLASALLFSHAQFATVAKTALYSSAFSANIYFFLNSGYFSPAAQENPLLHLWSLGLEEQFYLFLPMFCLWIGGRSRTRRVVILGAAGMGSLMLAVWQLRYGSIQYAFFLLPHRAWEFLAGVVLAALPGRGENRFTRILGGVGLILVLLPCLLLDKNASFPGVRALPSVTGALLLLRYGDAGVTGRLLCLGPVAALGKMSYSLYLWHWPVILFWRYLTFDQPGPADYAGMVVLSLLLARGTLLFVEDPVRRHARLRPSITLPASALLFLGIGAFSWAIVATDGGIGILHRNLDGFDHGGAWEGEIKDLQITVSPAGTPSPGADGPGAKTVLAVKRLGDPGAMPSFLVWGDSHAGSIAPGFHEHARTRRLAGYLLDDRQFPLSGISAFSPPPYQSFSLEAPALEPVFEWLRTSPGIQTVILHCYWAQYTNDFPTGSPFNQIRLGDAHGRAANGADNLALFRKGLEETLVRFESMAKKTVIVGGTPDFFRPVPQHHSQCRILGIHRVNSPGREEFQARQSGFLSVLDQLSSRGRRFVYLDPAAELWDGGGYRSLEDDTFLFRDRDHLTAAGARFVVSRMLARQPDVLPAASGE